MNPNNIPQSKRKLVKDAFEARDFAKLREICSEHKALPACGMCGTDKDIDDWLGYIFEYEPEWVNGKDIQL